MSALKHKIVFPGPAVDAGCGADTPGPDNVVAFAQLHAVQGAVAADAQIKVSLCRGTVNRGQVNPLHLGMKILVAVDFQRAHIVHAVKVNVVVVGAGRVDRQILDGLRNKAYRIVRLIVAVGVLAVAGDVNVAQSNGQGIIGAGVHAVRKADNQVAVGVNVAVIDGNAGFLKILQADGAVNIVGIRAGDALGVEVEIPRGFVGQVNGFDAIDKTAAIHALEAGVHGQGQNVGIVCGRDLVILIKGGFGLACGNVADEIGRHAVVGNDVLAGRKLHVCQNLIAPRCFAGGNGYGFRSGNGHDIGVARVYGNFNGVEAVGAVVFKN